MSKIIVKKRPNNKDEATAISIKTTVGFRNKWDAYCIENNINKKATLEAILTAIMNGELGEESK